MTRLLGALHAAGADGQVATVLDRDPAARASLDVPHGVAALLDELRKGAPPSRSPRWPAAPPPTPPSTTRTA